MDIESSNIGSPSSPLLSLQRTWQRLVLLWLLIWIGGYWLLQQIYSEAWNWLLLSGIVLAYGLVMLRRNLAHNHGLNDTALFPTLGPGNLLSMFRGLVIGLIAGFLVLPLPSEPLAWILALLYTVSSIADWVDGYVARRSGQVTLLGQQLDIEFDGLSVAVVSLLAVHFGQLPFWFLSVGLARYFFIFGIWWRQRQGQPCYDLPASVHRRIMAGMLMGMMTVVLWPIVPTEMTTLAAVVFAVPLLLGFSRDWLFTTGYLTADNQSYLRLQRVLYLVMARLLPPLWRLLLAVSMALIMRSAQPWYRPQAWLDLLISWHIPVSELLATVLSITAVMGIIMALLGFVGRLGAIILLFPIGFDIATRGLNWFNALALVCALCIALLGTGVFSLWQPEEMIVSQRQGSRE
ncbi:MAG: CDP-alcohol phosphatidyltransferase family protein [Candidatus Promineifilaceae bacterium]|nr:CDP-alcohol phosphatidyltransferase family protein [Candidatus Promineifilaceae bacterium]